MSLPPKEADEVVANKVLSIEAFRRKIFSDEKDNHIVNLVVGVEEVEVFTEKRSADVQAIHKSALADKEVPIRGS